MLKSLILLTLLPLVSHARLGDTLDQAEARYGLPKTIPKGSQQSRLLTGAQEYTFEFEGWRIQCLMLRAKDGQDYIVREEYTKMVTPKALKESGGINIQDFERDAILKGEAGNGVWEKKMLADAGKDLTSTAGNQLAKVMGLTGSVWVRSTDGARAKLHSGNGPFIFELPQAAKYEAEQKAIRDAKAGAAVPKF